MFTGSLSDGTTSIPLYDAQEERVNVHSQGTPIQSVMSKPTDLPLNKPNTFSDSDEGAHGWILVLRNDLDQINLNGTFSLTFNSDTTSMTWQNLVICREPQAVISTNISGDAKNAYLVELADMRHVARFHGANAIYNVGSNSGNGSKGPTSYSLESVRSGVVSNASVASPIVITSANHDLATGDEATITGVRGNTAANGTFTITVVDANTFSLNGSTGAAGTVTDATNATPIAITSDDHGLVTGDTVTITGAIGNTDANGTFTVTRIDADTFSLDGSTGNGTYTGSGTWTSPGGLWTSPWTWTALVADLWDEISDQLGTYPGLPIAPDGRPNGWIFRGIPVLDAIYEILQRIGCAITADLTLSSGSQYSIVQVGATDVAVETALTAAALLKIHDAEFLPIVRGKLPYGILVCFHKIFSSPFQVPPFLRPVAPHTVPIVGPDSGSAEPGLFWPIWDDLPAMCDGNGTITNTSALNTRAQSRADDYYRMARGDGGNRLWQRYSGFLSISPGSSIKCVSWRAVGETYGDRGIFTDVTRHPPANDCQQDYTSAGTSQDLVRLGFPSETTRKLRLTNWPMMDEWGNWSWPFVEQEISQTTDGRQTKTDGISGDGTTYPKVVEANNNFVNVPQNIIATLRGTTSGDVWEFAVCCTVDGPTVTPPAGVLTLAGFGPVATMTVFPDSGILQLDGFVPAFTFAVYPDAGLLTLTGYAPVTAISIYPDAGALTLTGFAPTPKESMTPGVGLLALDGFVPSIIGSTTIISVSKPGVLTLEGPYPSIIGSSVDLSPPLGLLTLTGYAPSAFASFTPTGAGALTLLGFAPTLSPPYSFTPTAAGALTLGGFAPTTSTSSGPGSTTFPGSGGSTTWTAPNTGTATFQCWGYGSGGGINPGASGSGGGGGQWVTATVNVTAGDVFTIAPGSALANCVVTTPLGHTLTAVRGSPGAGATPGAGGTGGAAVGASWSGFASHSGGAGGAGGASGPGGGGGGAGGPTSNGGAGTAGGGGGAGGTSGGTGSGAGGAGGTSGGNGHLGNDFGGGGGGGSSPAGNSLGGGQGAIKVTWT